MEPLWLVVPRNFWRNYSRRNIRRLYIQSPVKNGLGKITCVCTRIEGACAFSICQFWCFQQFQPEQPFDAVLSRAFTSLQQMLHWCHHLPGPDGCFLALKGQYPHEEIESLGDAYSITDVWPLQVPGLEGERHLVKILPAETNAGKRS